MAAAKSSFTPDQVALLAAGYDGTAPEEVRRKFVKDMADKMGKQVRSIIGKISTMKASHNLDYVPYSKPAPKIRKATNQELVNDLAELTGIDISIMNSLTRSSKEVLLALVAYAEAVKAEQEAETETEAGQEANVEIAGDEVAID